MSTNDLQFFASADLPTGGAPVAVRRRGRRVLIAYDPTCTRLDVTEWLVDNLPPEILVPYLAAYGLTFPLPPWTTRDSPAFLYVPPSLRLHICPPSRPCPPGSLGCAPALQGGDALRRRAARAQLKLERVALEAERRQEQVDLELVDQLAGV